MKKLNDARISIGRVTSNVESDYINISIYDNNSSLYILDIKLSLEEFAKTLTGMAHVMCQAEYNDSENIGKIRQIKEVVVKIKHEDYAAIEHEKFKQAVAHLETDGWTANHHEYKTQYSKRKVGDNLFQIPFERWV